ncbi:MAG: hypothetical protein GC160_11430 [Acidobacteria bacterium]|nr:hypothetical protein [Acidobacteriota bacterium]
MPVPSPITLDSEIEQAARSRAAQLGLSPSEYLRRLVESDLQVRRPQVDPSSIFALGDSGGSDIARDKEVMLNQAAEAAHPRR